jgi:hypothetical protein
MFFLAKWYFRLLKHLLGNWDFQLYPFIVCLCEVLYLWIIVQESMNITACSISPECGDIILITSFASLIQQKTPILLAFLHSLGNDITL